MEVHVIHLIGTAVGIVGTLYAIWYRPVAAWRRKVDERLGASDKEIALIKQRLESGDERFKVMQEDIREIKETLKRLEIAFAGSVFKGIGEAS